jgi:hypothetical protein
MLSEGMMLNQACPLSFFRSLADLQNDGGLELFLDVRQKGSARHSARSLLKVGSNNTRSWLEPSQDRILL